MADVVESADSLAYGFLSLWVRASAGVYLRKLALLVKENVFSWVFMGLFIFHLCLQLALCK